MNRFIVSVMMICFLVVGNLIILAQEKAPDDNKQLLFDLGILKYGKTTLKGELEVLVLKEGPVGVFTHQFLTDADGKSLKDILRNNGLVRRMKNTATQKMEEHVMVFNPKDKRTYTWVPFSSARQVAKQIKETGMTVPTEENPKRVSDKTIDQFENTLEF
jgi:hypothetical protein